MCIGRIIGLLTYWRTSPPTHDLLGLRYLGKASDRTGESTSRKQDAEESVSQIPLLAGVAGMSVKPMSARTAALYEYAQSVINKKPLKADESCREATTAEG
jgi:hypothetical protein